MDLKEINEVLNLYIRPSSFPVAYKLLRSDDELPERIRIPMRDLGYPITLCQATALTRRYGWTMALSKDDQCCILGAQAMGFVSAGGGSEIVPADKRHEHGKYKYHLTAALDRADFQPDVIAIYGNSAQIMRLVQSARGGLEGRGTVNAVATGVADCGDIAARTVLSDECQSILPSGGDRIFAGLATEAVHQPLVSGTRWPRSGFAADGRACQIDHPRQRGQPGGYGAAGLDHRDDSGHRARVSGTRRSSAWPIHDPFLS